MIISLGQPEESVTTGIFAYYVGRVNTSGISLKEEERHMKLFHD